MIEFPPAKLNLGLQIIAKRTDGFHDLQTVFYQFPLNDVLEIIKDDSLEPGQCSLISTGLPIPVVKTYVKKLINFFMNLILCPVFKSIYIKSFLWVPDLGEVLLMPLIL